MNNKYEDQLETKILESFNLTEDMANSLAGDSADNATPLFTITISIITSASEC